MTSTAQSMIVKAATAAAAPNTTVALVQESDRDTQVDPLQCPVPRSYRL
jgi:hypothetical protein